MFNEPIKQRQLEAWSDAYLTKPRNGRTKNNGAIVRAAIEVGWLTKGTYTSAKNGTPESYRYDGEDVDDMDGWRVEEIAEKVNGRYNEAMTVPLASSSPLPSPQKGEVSHPENSPTPGE